MNTENYDEPIKNLARQLYDKGYKDHFYRSDDETWELEPLLKDQLRLTQSFTDPNPPFPEVVWCRIGRYGKLGGASAMLTIETDKNHSLFVSKMEVFCFPNVFENLGRTDRISRRIKVKIDSSDQIPDKKKLISLVNPKRKTRKLGN